MVDNWTLEELRGVVITALEIDQQDFVNLDVEHADKDNIKAIIKYCNNMGYKAKEIPESEIIRVEKVKGKNE